MRFCKLIPLDTFSIILYKVSQENPPTPSTIPISPLP